MRVTAQTKLETDNTIRAAARKLFARRGFDETSTRQIAAAAGIATGTLYNYYPTKEALALDLIATDLAEALAEFRALPPAPTLAESLFALVATGLRRLAPLRPAVGGVLESGLSPFTAAAPSSPAARLRTDQLDAAAAVLSAGGIPDPGIIAMHLYWTLYLGILSFWAADASPNQEDTLALLDQAMRMFVGNLETSS